MKMNNWSLPTRFLHIGLVSTVTAQLFISLVMAEPDHAGNVLSKAAFTAHEYVGLTALGIVLLHWIWSSLSHVDGGLTHLFPVFGTARQQLVAEIKGLMRGKLPKAGKKGGISGLVHGLGLLAVTGIAITGGFLFVLFPETGEPGALAEVFAELHEGLAGLVWAYWLGHGGMALLHHFSGQDLLKKMFSFRDAKYNNDAFHDQKHELDLRETELPQTVSMQNKLLKTKH